MLLVIFTFICGLYKYLTNKKHLKEFVPKPHNAIGSSNCQRNLVTPPCLPAFPIQGNAVQCAVRCESQYDGEATSGGYWAEGHRPDS